MVVSLPVSGAAPASLHLAFARGGQLDPATFALATGVDSGSGAIQAVQAVAPDLATAARLVAALRDARYVAVGLDEAAVTMPLDGAAAALRWMDAVQGRAGARTALAATGERTPTPPLPLVTVRAPRRGPSPDPKQAPAAVRAVFASADCGRSVDGKGGLGQDFADEDTAARLTGRLTLWGRVCSGGAYNFGFRFVLMDEAAHRARLVRFPPVPGRKQGGDDDPSMLTNASFNPATGTLTSFYKSRGIADCGLDDRYGWDGRGFRLIGARSMPDCRGVPPDAWPSVFRTRQR